MDYAAIVSAMGVLGLGDPRVLAEADFADAGELFLMLFPEAEEKPSLEVMQMLQDKLDRSGPEAALKEQVVRPSSAGGLDDSLWSWSTMRLLSLNAGRGELGPQFGDLPRSASPSLVGSSTWTRRRWINGLGD
jgi:hypothetical protein